jgi:WD40 repeat protein
MTIDPTKLKVAESHSRKEILFRMAVSGDRILAGGSDAIIHEINLAEKPTEDVRQLAQHRGYISGCVCHENTLISGAYDGKLIWWDIEKGEVSHVIEKAHRRWVRHIALSNDGKLAASVSDDMDCHVWDVAKKERIHTLKGHAAKTPHHFPSMLYVAAFSNDGKHLATADKVGKIVIWSLETGKQVAEMMAETMYTWDPKQRIHSIGGIRSLAFSPDDKSVAAGGIGQIGNIDHLGAKARIDIFDWEKQERTLELPGDTHNGLVEQLRFSPNGEWLLAIGGDNGGFIQFYDTATGKILWQDKAPMHVHDVWLDNDGGKVVAVGHQRIVVWRASEENVEKT